MSFKITIEVTKTVMRTTQEWVRLNADSPTMGYAPKIEQPQTVREDIYSQTVEELDLAAVIATVNKDLPCG